MLHLEVLQRLLDNHHMSYSIKIHTFSLILAWIAATLAIPTLVLQIYGDYFIFVTFVHNLHQFIIYNLSGILYYIFPLGIIYVTIRKKIQFIWLTVFFLPTVIYYQVNYLIGIWFRNIGTLAFYTEILAILTCLMLLFALLSAATWFVENYRAKRRYKHS